MTDFSELSGKVALVTGASRGIGAAAAEILAAAGVRVMLTARSESAIAALAETIVGQGGEAAATRCDVARHDDVEAATARTLERFGRLDILVNNAGLIEPIGRIDALSPSDFGQVIDVNLKGVFYGIRAAAPIMIAQGGGVIVNVSSGAATSPMEGWSHYCASKAGALMLTRAADMELAEHGVRAIGLSPGTVDTEMQVAIKMSGVNPVSKLERSDHIPADWPGRAIAWACTADAADFYGGDVRLREESIRRRVGLI